MNNKLPIVTRGIFITAFILVIAGLLATTPAQSAFWDSSASGKLSIVNYLITGNGGSLSDINITTQLTLIKDPTNDNGGNAAPDDFLLTIGTEAATSGVPKELTPETPYAINETQQTGYTFVEIIDNDVSGKCPTALGDTITLTAGDDITCTIVNDDVAPQLTLVKEPTNDSGGTALPDDFLLTIGGDPATSGVAKVLAANTSYTINETQQPGYTFVEITDDGSGKCPIALGGTITLAEGDDITCTIVNDDLPRLTIVKDPTNDNGGSAAPDDFLLTVGGSPVLSGVPTEYPIDTLLAIDETQLVGYEFVSITDDGSGKCPTALGGTITLALGDDITCTIVNDDVPAIKAVPAADLVTDENGTTDEFTVVLTTLPSADVVIAVSSDDPSEGTVAPVELTFTTTDWFTPQLVTVTGVNDMVADGDIPYLVILDPATSTDAEYAALAPVEITATNFDNDIPGYIINPVDDLTTTEGGGSQKVEISLRSEPTALVSMSLFSSDLTEGTVSPANLIIDPATWPQPAKEITITGVDDILTDGNIVYTVTITASSTDPDYSGPVAELSVTNHDAPTIKWVKPINPIGEDDRDFYVEGLGPILLECESVGNEPISKVRWYRWVPTLGEFGDFVTIGEDITAPYQETIDPKELEFGANEIRCFAFSPVPTLPGEIQTFSPYPLIWIYKEYGANLVYLPLVYK